MSTAVGILPFRTASYAQGIYALGNNRLTARTENGISYTGVSAGYYIPVEEYAANLGNVQNPIIITRTTIDNALAKGWLSQQEHDETIAYIPLPTPVAPSVSADDVNNIITGIDSTMEYALDGATTYTTYNVDTPPILSGDHTVNVRVAAVANVNLVGAEKTLAFTINPVTPPAPLVIENDINNTVTGMDITMEYNLDSEGYIPYVEATFNTIVFKGVHTLDVRVMAEGLNPVGLVTTLDFTVNE